LLGPFKLHVNGPDPQGGLSIEVTQSNSGATKIYEFGWSCTFVQRATKEDGTAPSVMHRMDRSPDQENGSITMMVR
jgi:hypothetical protein